MEVRTRFAPSPTGAPQVGNIRTALFSYFFARNQKGKFILRIEDTDQARKVEGAEEVIKESLSWIGVDWDQYVIQSGRLNEYTKYANELVSKGLAKEEDGAIRFIIPNTGETSWIDGVGKKKITFQNKDIENFIILKKDGFPTYHLANIVDDHLMEITHIIRGDDWIPSTPKHIMLYKAFGWDLPKFVHAPNVLGADGKKLSKRFGAKSVLDYKKDGYLPESLLNYLILLGWSPKNDQEILSKEEIEEQFSLENINQAPAVFDERKLEWMNGEYIRKMSDQELTKRLQEFLVDHPAKDKIRPVVPLIKERIKKLSDFIPLTDFLWEDPEYEKEVFNKLKIDNLELKIKKVLEKLESLEKSWKADIFEKTFRDLAKQLDLSASQMFQLIRVAISGQTVTPPLFESIKILGEEETIKRVKRVLQIF